MYLKLNCYLILLAVWLQPIASESINVNRYNVDNILHTNELVLLMFHSPRCPFSLSLMPIFDAAADQLRAQFGDSGKVQLGKVNCLKERDMESEFDVGKYPTIKIVRHSHVGRGEYRGKRSLAAITQFVIKELQDHVEEIDSLDDIKGVMSLKYMVIGYYELKDHAEYEIYRKAASTIKDNCHFYVKFSEQHVPNKLTFRQHVNHTESHVDYSHSLSNFTGVLQWFHEKCDPSVRELTFHNAEEITEEGLPLVILFHNKEDVTSPKDFTKVVNEELRHELDHVNFVTAIGKNFAHPLQHIGRTTADLPLIVIDSFEHMYTFPKYAHLHGPGKLKEFIAKLHSGELHFAYHFVDSEEDTEQSMAQTEEAVITMPPHSKFKELMPSKQRYTYARDEL